MTDEIRQDTYGLPPGAVDLYLIRHGESEAAKRGQLFDLVDGQGDPALHPNGVKQAEAMAARMQHVAFDAIYVTNLRRTQQTAEPLAAAVGLTPIVEPDLREVFMGDWEGGLWRFKAADNDPIYQRVQAKKEWGEIPGGESNAELEARVGAALDRIYAAHSGQTVAAVVHGGVIGAIFDIASHSRERAFTRANNCSVSRVFLTEEGIKIRGFNDCVHLDGLIAG